MGLVSVSYTGHQGDQTREIRVAEKRRIILVGDDLPLSGGVHFCPFDGHKTQVLSCGTSGSCEC